MNISNTNILAKSYYFISGIALIGAIILLVHVKNDHENEKVNSYTSVIKYQRNILEKVYFLDMEELSSSDLNNMAVVPGSEEKPGTTIYRYTLTDSSAIIPDKQCRSYLSNDFDQQISRLLNLEIIHEEPTLTILTSGDVSYLASLSLQSDSSGTYNRLNVIVLNNSLESILEAISYNSQMYSSFMLNDTTIISNISSPCINEEIQYTSLTTNDVRYFKCSDENKKQTFSLINADLFKDLKLITIIRVKQTNPVLWLLLILIIILATGIVFIPYLNRNRYKKQLNKISDVVNRISEKDFDVILTEDHESELSELISSINKMRIQLKEIYENLEIRVIRRTSEISMRNAELRKTQRELLTQNHELKSAYEALKESREKYEKLIEHLEDEYFFYSKATDGTLLFVSNSVKKILGYEKKEYRQIHDKIYTNDTINKQARRSESALHEGKSQPKFLKVVSDINKQDKILEVSEVPVFNDNGNLVSIEGLAHDITEQRKAEEIIKEQEEKYRMLFTHASDFIIMYEINPKEKTIGNFIEANNYTIEKLGYSLDELRARSPMDILAAEIWNDKEILPEEFAQSEETFERIWEAKSGNILSVEISAHSFQIKESEVVIAVARDITDRKRTEEEIRFVNEELINQKENLEALVDNLTQTQEQLVQSEKMAALGQLIAGIAHEINTPLGAIKASIGNLSDSLNIALGELPELFQTQSLDNLKLFTTIFEYSRTKKTELSSREKRQMRRELSGMLSEGGIKDPNLLADTLVYLEIYPDTAKGLISSFQLPDALKVIRSARNFISLLKNTNTINIAVEKATKVVFALKKYAHRDAEGEKTSTDIIDSIETVLTLYNNQLKQGVEIIKEYGALPLVQCLKDEMSQVWTNLIHNAIQAMRQEGSITITTHHKDEYVYISFKDTGPGIEPDIIDKIFDPFFTTKKAGEGSGLGLDIVKKIIDKHNGNISVESNLGAGAKFIIKLPVE